MIMSREAFEKELRGILGYGTYERDNGSHTISLTREELYRLYTAQSPVVDDDDDYCDHCFRGKEQKECSACSGSGHYDHDGAPKCGSCNGTGKESKS